ncbi:Fur family transcriptional regulator [Simiduia aestuariiviva]|uniref:Fur family zinc uptake transcriptional regulator n=1 Tax=Simiduia aestuariiviva TaxID=1510459 RepID=A0A839UUK3_9GAMM|nr:Fur family transcriptional regulator [Simiduia aestuariiviva]MBB3169676.1 Fur family zinc uptake transcriptional regulator [Simiduia aestuariiviva]
MPQHALPFRRHNHQHCIADALAAARALAKARGLRLTLQREQVLRLIWQNHKPVGAYQLMEQLAELTGKQVAPPTVYRALEFLLEHRLIHRLNSLNAFIGCACPDTGHAGQFVICRACGIALELNEASVRVPIQALAQSVGFQIEQQTLELSGLCPNCQTADAITEEPS